MLQLERCLEDIDWVSVALDNRNVGESLDHLEGP
jgi:hypothetical protein